MTTVNTVRYVFEGDNLSNIIKILYNKRNYNLATVISSSILRDKTINALYINPARQALLQQELIQYIYSIYNTNFGSANKQVVLSNRIRDIQKLDPVQLYQDATYNYFLDNGSTLINKINRIDAKIRNFPYNNDGQQIENKDELLLEQQNIRRVLDYFIETKPNQQLILSEKKTYVVNPNFINPTVYDLTPNEGVRNRRYRVARLEKDKRTVGIFFDPEVYNNSFNKRVSVGRPEVSSETQDIEFSEENAELNELLANGDIDLDSALDLLSDEERFERQELVNSGQLDEDEFLLTEETVRTSKTKIFTRYSYDRKRANDLLNAFNGRLRKQTFALYIDAIQNGDRAIPINLTFYSLRNTLTKEYLLPIFNTNQLQSGYGYFNRDSARNFNIQNL